MGGGSRATSSPVRPPLLWLCSMAWDGAAIGVCYKKLLAEGGNTHEISHCGKSPVWRRAFGGCAGCQSENRDIWRAAAWLVKLCVGHLVGLAPPTHTTPSISNWTYEDLPIVPTLWWQFTVDPGKRIGFRCWPTLMNRADVDGLVCATDAGREGNSIFRLVYQQAGCRNRWNGCGFRRWRRKQSRRAFWPCAPVQTMTGCLKRPCAAPGLTGLWGITGTRLFSTLYPAL